MSTTPQAVQQRRRVLKRFGRLLDLTTDVDRAASDSDFLDGERFVEGAENKIYYVFDENVFELFINPGRQASFCENFYSKEWIVGSRDHVTEYSAQAGLIAAEYLFSDSLRGREANDPIYLTEWHFKELRSRLRTIRDELHATGRELLEQGNRIDELVADEIDQLATLIQDVANDERLEKIVERASEATRPDLIAFIDSMNAGLDPQAAGRFVLARELAARLVQDTVLEPLHQLRRIYTEIFPRIRPLSLRFPATELDGEELRRRTFEWIENLQNQPGRKKKDGSVHYDARSVAYVHWVARHKLARNERIVLVTGDAKLFDAYRNWYRQRDPGEAFLLRKINQYGPLINPHDIPNDISDQSGPDYYLFDNLRRAIDAPMLTFNIATRDGDRKRALEGAREHLATLLVRRLKPEEEPAIAFFISELSAEWWKQRDSGFSELRDQWQQTERLTIGTSLPSLAQRLEGRMTLHAEITADSGAATEAFSRYLQKLLDEIMIRGIELDLPDAIKFVASGVERDRKEAEREHRPPARAPIRARFRIPIALEGEAARAVDFESLRDDLFSANQATMDLLDPVDNRALRGRPDILFAVAATLAIRHRVWEEGVRFSEDALTAAATVDFLARHNARMDIHRREHGRDVQVRLAEAEIAAAAEGQPQTSEYRYILAVARRYAIADRAPHITPEDEDGWRGDLRATVDILNELESEHGAAGETRQQLRAIAERLAIRLCYATWGAALTLDELHKCHYPFAFAAEQYAAALEDLDRFWALYDRSDKNADLEALYQPLLINAASLLLIGPRLKERTRALELAEPTAIERVEHELKPVVDSLDQFPAIVAVDVLAFFFFVAERHEYRARLDAALSHRQLNELLLDQKLAAMVRERLRASAAPSGAGPKAKAKARRPRASPKPASGRTTPPVEPKRR